MSATEDALSSLSEAGVSTHHHNQTENRVSDERFDRFTRYVKEHFSVLAGLIVVVDHGHDSIQSLSGKSDPSVFPDGITAAVLLEDEILVIPDVRIDPRFMHNPLITEESSIRFFAGAILHGPGGQPVGVLCIVDTQPRELSEDEKQDLIGIAHLVNFEFTCTQGFQGRVHQSMLGSSNISGLFDNLDNTTGLLGTEAFSTHLQQKVEISKITDDDTVLVGCLGINHLSEIRDVAGESIANMILREIVNRISNRYHQALVGRYEDDRFCFCLPLIGSSNTIDNLAVELLDAFNQPIEFADFSFLTDVRFGLSQASVQSDDASELLRMACCAHADLVNQSQSGYQIFGRNASSRTSNKDSMESRLRAAIQNDELFLFYQPTVDLKSGMIVGAEVLCRWTDDYYGDVSPSQFFALAERAGMCDMLDDWVIRAVCKQIRGWKDDGVDVRPVAINLTGTRLREADFCKYLKELLVEYGLRGDDLIFEVNEGSLSVNTETTIMNMDEIRCLGVKFSIDDFGTGYSSLRYLHLLPAHTLKIDRSFIQHVATSQDDSVIAKTIIFMAKGLGMRVIAEGIETVEQVKYLQKNGCTIGQGYLFSRPLALNDYEVLLDQGSDYRRLILSCHEDETTSYFNSL